ncbi:MAG: protein kinase [Planctomycetia bacterium]|nr:protein kinase [Planctomycetia bacterium]
MSSIESVAEDAIRQFEHAWQSGTPPEIESFIVEGADSQLHLLIELIHVELEFRYHRNDFPRIEEYLKRFPQLLEYRDKIIELIASEFFLCNRFGQTATVQDFITRFPQYREEIARLLAAYGSTVTWPRRKPQKRPTVFPTIPGYIIEEELGQGGMGVVYRASQPSLQRAVAIKTLLHGTAATQELKNRFRVEAESIARLDHPHLVPIYEVGEWTPQGAATSIPYFVMKFYPGGSLAMEPSGPGTDMMHHARMVETIAHAVHHAHQRGILHRDLKPSNILLDEKGEPHVVDFGLAGRFDPNDPQSMTATIIGTPAYMAPEQARSPSQVTTAADVYGLGAILYQLMTGKAPFRVDSPLAMLEMIAHHEPVKPSTLNPAIPRDLETICMKCMQKDPASRYDSPASLASDLARLRTGQSILARPMSTWEKSWRTIRRYPMVSSLIALTFLMLVGSVAVLALSNFRIREQERETHDALQRERWVHSELINTFNREQQLLYGKRIASVGRLWATNQVAQAWEELDLCPEKFRGWEWRYFDQLRTNGPITIPSPPVIFRTTAFISNQQIVTGDSRGHITIWNWKDKQPQITWQNGPKDIRGLTVFPAKQWLAVCDEDKLTIWNYVTQKKLAVLRGNMWAAFSPDGTMLAASHTTEKDDYTNDVMVWDTSTWQTRWLLQGHSKIILDGSFSPDSKTLVSSSTDRTIRRWNMQDGKQTGEVWKRQLPTFRISYFADGKHLAEAQPSSIMWTDAESGREMGRYNWANIVEPKVLTGRVQFSISADPDIIAFSGPSHDILVWDIRRNRSLMTFRGHQLHISSVAFSPDGKHLSSTSNDKSLRIWDLQQPTEYQSMGSFPHLTHDFTLSNDGQWAAIIPNYHSRKTGDDFVRVINTGDGTERGCYKGVGAAQFIDNDHLLTSIPEGGLTCWDLKTGNPVWIHASPDQHCQCMGLSPDGKHIVAIQLSGTIKWLNRANGIQVEELPLVEKFMGQAVFSPQVDKLAYVGRHQVELMDLVTKTKTVGIPMNGTRKMAFSIDGKLIATAEADRVIRLRDTTTGAIQLTFPGHPRAINSLAFSKDGKRIVTSCSDGLIRLWDVETGLELTALPGQFEESVLVTWDHSQDRIVAIDSKVYIWKASPELKKDDEKKP